MSRFVDSPYTSWTRNPEYVEACRTIPRAGDPTAYVPAHPDGASRTDVTTFKVGLAKWNEQNLPDIFYQLWPCKAWKSFRDGPKPGPKRDAQGNPIREKYPRSGHEARVIRDFDILKGINKNVGKRFVKPKDRKPDDPGKFTNCINNRCRYGRIDWNMVSWREKSKLDKPNETRDGVLNGLTPAQRAGNTTRGKTPGPDLLGNVIPVPPSKRTTRRRHAGSSTQTGDSRPKSSSGRPRKTKQKSRASRHNNEADDDVDCEGIDLENERKPNAASITRTVSRPQRKTARAITYAVENASEDSADSEFMLEKRLPAASTKRKRVRNDEVDEPFEATSSMTSVDERSEQLNHMKPAGPSRKKQKICGSNGATEKPTTTTTDTTSVDEGAISRPRRVSKTQKHRTPCSQPHSTTSAMDKFSSHACRSQATYESLPASNHTLHSTSGSRSALYSESTTRHHATNQHIAMSSQYDLNPGSMYQDQSTYDPLGYAAKLDEGMFGHTEIGLEPPAPSYAYQIMGQSSEQRYPETSYLANPIDNLVALHHEDHGFQGGMPASYSAQSNNQLLPPHHLRNLPWNDYSNDSSASYTQSLDNSWQGSSGRVSSNQSTLLSNSPLVPGPRATTDDQMEPSQDFDLLPNENQPRDRAPAVTSSDHVTWSPIQNVTDPQGELSDDHEEHNFVDPSTYNSFENYADPAIFGSECAYTTNDSTYPF